MKVHFAGSEGSDIFDSALYVAEIHYRLYSCYKYIVNKNVGDDFRLPKNDTIITQCQKMRHVIQDSGLFTLMFGAGAGEEQSYETMINWQDKLIEFVKQNDLNSTCVELDCQKLLGVKEAWKLRERMKNKLPNRQINVWHVEDGKSGLDSLVDFSDYIAISVPELRKEMGSKHKENTKRLAYYIKSRKPEIDIHLLGCTDFSMMKENKFCTSCDSTSWLQGVKYGFIGDGKIKSHVRNFDRELVLQREQECRDYLAKRGIEIKPKTLRYTANASISASICKQRYEKILGEQ